MRRFSLQLLIFIVCACSSIGQTSDNGCKLKFGGAVSSRKAVKMRPSTRNYPKFKNGDPITVNEFLTDVCLEAAKKVPSPVPVSTTMVVEKQTITMRAFVLAMKLDPDNDLHIQIGDKPKPFSQPQLIVEIPPTEAYCDARTNMMDLLREDSGGTPKQFVFKHPPEVELTGYLFLDSHHGSTCTASGGRGIKNGLKASPVKSTWEIHPVIKLTTIS